MIKYKQTALPWCLFCSIISTNHELLAGPADNVHCLACYVHIIYVTKSTKKYYETKLKESDIPWYTTGLTPCSFKNTIAGADSTPNLLLIIRTPSRSYSILEKNYEAPHFWRWRFTIKFPKIGRGKGTKISLPKKKYSPVC